MKTKVFDGFGKDITKDYLDLLDKAAKLEQENARLKKECRAPEAAPMDFKPKAKVVRKYE